MDREPKYPGKQARREDVKFAVGKIAVVQYASVVIFLFLITGFWDLQIQNPQMYNEQAKQPHPQNSRFPRREAKSSIATDESSWIIVLPTA